MQTKSNIAQAGGQIFWFSVYFLSFKTTRLQRPGPVLPIQTKTFSENLRKREKSVIFLASFLLLCNSFGQIQKLLHGHQLLLAENPNNCLVIIYLDPHQKLI